jgi:hypothetical protein
MLACPEVLGVTLVVLGCLEKGVFKRLPRVRTSGPSLVQSICMKNLHNCLIFGDLFI